MNIVKHVDLGALAPGLTGAYHPDGRVRFEARPTRDWEFMATGTGVTGLTVNFQEAMLLQLNHAASIDEAGKVRALGRLHLELDGSPFASSSEFRMETDFRHSLILAEAQTASGPVRIEIRAQVPLDAFRIDIFDERAEPGTLRIRIEGDAPMDLTSPKDGLAFFLHTNPADGEGIDEGTRHWLAGRTFGLGMDIGAGKGATVADGQLTAPPASHHVLHIVGASERDGKDAFLHTVAGRLRQLAEMPRDEFVRSHEEWWRRFWERSSFRPEAPDGRMIRYQAAFDLFRYYTACCTSDRRETPARFQIDLYRYHLRQHGWLTFGICAVETYQAIGGALRTGDWETLRSQLRFYQENLPFYRDQAQRVQGVTAGAFIFYAQKPWTTRPGVPLKPEECPPTSQLGEAPYNGDNPAGPLFMLALGSEYVDASGDHAFAEDTLRPLATEVLEYFRLRYPREADGRIAFDPCNAGETWQAVRNPTEIVCAFRYALTRLLETGSRHGWPKDLLGPWRDLLAAAPEIPRGRFVFDEDARDIKPAILPGDLLVPAESMEGCKSYVMSWSEGKAWYKINSQQTELFAIWPTRLILDHDDNRRAARDSYAIRHEPHILYGWDLDVVHAASLGLLDEVTAWFDKHFDHIYTLPCGLAWEVAPRNPATDTAAGNWIPESPSLQGMGSGVIPVLEMLLQDFPDRIVVLPCWPEDVPVSFTLHSAHAGRVEVRYRPGESLDVKLERPHPVSSPLRDLTPLRISSSPPANHA